METKETKIDEKFSAQAFANLGLNSHEARQLADLLANEIQQELHSVIETALNKIVEKMNKMGHNLALYEKPIPGEISYRDCSGGDCEDGCKLRVAVDTIISTGYAHLIGFDQLDD